MRPFDDDSEEEKPKSEQDDLTEIFKLGSVVPPQLNITFDEEKTVTNESGISKEELRRRARQKLKDAKTFIP